MPKLFLVLSLLILTMVGACTTTNPAYLPQPNEHYPIERTVATPGDSAFGDAVGIVGDEATMSPAQATLRVEWRYIAPCPKRGRFEGRRVLGEFVIRPEGSINAISYPLHHDRYNDSVKRVGNDYWAIFYVDGTKHEIPFTEVDGGFVDGGFYENPPIGRYGNCRANNERNALRIVWSSHAPIRGYAWLQKLFR